MKVRFLPLIIPLLFSLSCVTPKPENSVSNQAADVDTAASENMPATETPEVSPDPRSGDQISGNEVDKPEVSAGSEAVQTLPPLTEPELFSKIYSMMPWNVNAVMDGGRPIVILHDLDKNGYEDALVVAVEGRGEIVDLEDFSKSARLFQSGQEYAIFLLLIFYQSPDGVVLRYTVPVSKQLVFNGVEPIEIKRGSDFPYALKFSFRTRSGIEQELIILSGYGITRFTIKENLSEISLMEDIDEDGYEDIIVHEQGFEEGTGFETFITWYKWNLREYTEYKTTNIVRNLRDFFLICSEYLRAGQISSFLDYALDSEALTKLKTQGYSDTAILEMIFRSSGDPESVSGFFDSGGFTTVVFPEIMETPFSYANRMDFRHQVSVRLGRMGHQSEIFLADLSMKKNPFQNKQFCFIIEE
ncbi:MAG: hypothetical protein PQJ61_05435 [Spirochaetales bacterium]|uniref:Uncharacterized protein n=1 Tax=Candidatus Thalassospirochaeta sargassi TaxID=3119039 RepID=A0AAJ1MJV5_9SPIO|nr:hypothetical protein [Spirochaetales bacterium]